MLVVNLGLMCDVEQAKMLLNPAEMNAPRKQTALEVAMADAYPYQYNQELAEALLAGGRGVKRSGQTITRTIVGKA